MLIKIHKGARYAVAVCDSEIFGKKYEDSDGIRQIDLTGNFFKGEEKNEQEVKEILLDMKREDACFNFVGKDACEAGKKVGIIKEEGILEIANIPIALVLA